MLPVLVIPLLIWKSVYRVQPGPVELTSTALVLLISTTHISLVLLSRSLSSMQDLID